MNNNNEKLSFKQQMLLLGILKSIAAILCFINAIKNGGNIIWMALAVCGTIDAAKAFIKWYKSDDDE